MVQVWLSTSRMIIRRRLKRRVVEFWDNDRPSDPWQAAFAPKFLARVKSSRISIYCILSSLHY